MPISKEKVDKMTLQEACDYAIAKLIEQGDRCMSGFCCVYDDGEGNHCAIGHLMSTIALSKIALDDAIYSITKEFQLYLPDLIVDNIDAFSILQTFHDQAGYEKREESLCELAAYIDVTGEDYKTWLDMVKPGEYAT